MNITELRIEMMRHGDTGETLAKALGITRPTLSRKMNSNNSDFTQSEIIAIKSRYELSSDRVSEIFFSDN